MALLSLQMTDNPDDVSTCLPTRTAPRVAGIPQGDGTFSYFVLIENQVVFSVHSFAKAMVYWFVCHYVFNLQYCKQAKEVATFFQEYVFGLLTSLRIRVLHISVFVVTLVSIYIVEDM